MTKDLLIGIIGSVLIFLFVSDINISVKPFKIEMPNWPLALGYVFLLIGAELIYFNGHRDGEVEGEIRATVKYSGKAEEAKEDIQLPVKETEL